MTRSISKLEFSSRPILIIGDLILDSYLNGNSSRLSPEAPVPIVNVKGSEFSLGGAGNVAANIKALGGTPITIGITGKDADGDGLAGIFLDMDISTAGIIRSGTRRTTTKTRVTVNRHQIVRLDREDTSALSDQESEDLIWRLGSLINGAAAIIISDYAKGVITDKLLREIKFLASMHQIPVFVDPRIEHGHIYAFLNGTLTCISPNMPEVAGLARMHVTNVDEAIEAGKIVLYAFGCKHALITLGEHGMALLTYGKDDPVIIQATAREVFDVAGAGDTVVAALVLASISGYSMEVSAKIANAAAGVVVEKSGTAVVTVPELIFALNEQASIGEG